MSLPEPIALAPQEIRIGLSAEFERDVSAEDVLAFARNSGDYNPLHVDEDYACQTAFKKPIVHGAFQVGLASALLGMYLPGRNVLLGTINARFVQPLYFPARVRVRGEITQWRLASQSGSLKVVIQDSNTRNPTAEITLGFTFHDRETREAPRVATPRRSEAGGEMRRVLITGASGEVGAAIATDLARDHHIVAIVDRRPLSEELRAAADVVEITADLTSPDWEELVSGALDGDSLHAIVHAAWPGAPRGGLLASSDEVIEQQVSFATLQTIRLARFLASTAPPEGGRLIALGALSGSHKPQLGTASYSLAKAALELVVRLLAPELARRKITVNAVCPSPTGTGMHRFANDAQALKESALVPMGRLCSAADVAASIRFLLSPEAGFISGQAIPISGAQL